jgi:hypothetical protein
MIALSPKGQARVKTLRIEGTVGLVKTSCIAEEVIDFLKRVENILTAREEEFKNYLDF